MNTPCIHSEQLSLVPVSESDGYKTLRFSQVDLVRQVIKLHDIVITSLI